MDSSYKGPMVLQSYFKKLKKGRKIGWFISKFTKRWFVLDMIRGNFYYTENHSKANPDKVYKLKEIGDLEENPKSVERCDWKFPFIIYAIDRKYVLHAETSSIRDDWCAAIRWVIKKNQMPRIQSKKNGENKINVSLDLSYREIEKEKPIEGHENEEEILVENQSKTYQIITTKIKNMPNMKTFKIINAKETNPLSNKKQNWIEGENNKEDLENKMVIDNMVDKVKEVKQEEDDEAKLTDRQSYHITHNDIFNHPSTIEDFQSAHINFSQNYEDTRHRRAFISTQKELYSDYKNGSFTNTQIFEDKSHVEDLESSTLSKISVPSNIIKDKDVEFDQKALKSNYTKNQSQVNTASFQHHRKVAEIIVDPVQQFTPKAAPPAYSNSAPIKENKSNLEHTEYLSRLSNIKPVSTGRSPNAIRRLRNTANRQKIENISLDLSTNSINSPNRSVFNNTQPNISPKLDASFENIGEENNNSRLESQDSAPSSPKKYNKKLLKGKFIYKKSSQPSPTYKDVLVKNSAFQNEIDDANSREKMLLNINRQSSRSSSESRGESPSILESKLNPPIREVSRSKKKIKTVLVEPSTAKVRDSIINELYQPIKPITQVKPRLSSSFFSRQQSFNFETRKNEPTEESYIY
ncbi:unnamed protein product [Blepharisma stoltei]|uniref:PH domain-containing protein n=1 Tax=Blepharisma stoltei TaxID=1481888 RepID=A0AAU9JJ60_9CILI|nr:unnamed protein product [Blepharisma stoltei]